MTDLGDLFGHLDRFAGRDTDGLQREAAALAVFIDDVAARGGKYSAELLRRCLDDVRAELRRRGVHDVITQ